MNCTGFLCEERLRLVGDPVDVVTGANIDRSLDFRLPGPLPLEWHRYYNSAHNEWRRALGWGHTHEFDARLVFDVDGVTYTSAKGKSIGFPVFAKDGLQLARSGVILRRVTEKAYLVLEHRKPALEFVFKGTEPVGRLARTFQNNSSITFQYGKEGFLEYILDSLGRTVLVHRDEGGRVVQLAWRESATGGKRNILSCSYDTPGNLVRCVDGYGNLFSFEYDNNNRMVSKKDRRGYSFHYEYDKAGRCTRCGGEDGMLEVRLSYSPSERVTVVTRANGGQWEYWYNESGTVTKIIDPYGGVRAFSMNSLGQISEEIDPNGDVTRWIYGPSRALIAKCSSFGEYSNGNIDPVRPHRRPHAVPTRSLQWEFGNLFSIRGMMASHSYNRAARAAAVPAAKSIARDIDESGVLSAFKTHVTGTQSVGVPDGDSRVYDDFGLLIREKDLSGKSRRWNYDTAGNTARYHDRDGSTYQYEYTSCNLRARRIDPLGQVVYYSYTPTARLAKITDPGGTCTEYIHDLKDRIVEVWRGGSLKEQYCYDKVGNLAQKLDGNGDPLLTFEIGPGNLATVRHLACGTLHKYTYDKHGLYAELISNECNVQFDYDLFRNRNLDKRDGRGLEHEFAGPKRLARSTVFNRFRITYSYPRSGLCLIKDPGGQQHSIRSMGNGFVFRCMSNGTSELIQFDATGRCTSKESISRLSRLHSIHKYSYSGEGYLVQSYSNLYGVVRYKHDAAHRLSSALNGDRTDIYRYDDAGNLLEQPGLRDVDIGRANQLSRANGDEFEYNDRHNIAARRGVNGKTRYLYDSRDMLVRCVNKAGEWKYSYDALGRRTTKSDGTRRADFYWDTDRLVAEVRGNGSLRIYIYADAFAMTPLMFIDYSSSDADPASGIRYFVFSNQVGAPIRVEDGQGNVVWSARVDPYGAAHISNDTTIEMSLRFPGHYFDAETGLHYNRFRYYSPELGRYLQSDPIGIAGGLNVYAYTSNPLRQVDVRGLAEPPCESGPLTEEDNEPNPAEDEDQEPSPWEAMLAGAKEEGEEEPPGATEDPEAWEEMLSDSVPSEGEPDTNEPSDYVGGSYEDVREQVDGGEVHHMPADSVSPLTTDEGPGISMDTDEHQQTKSWGSSDEAKDYRQQQQDLIDQGRFKDAQQMDIDDLRSKFGDKYDDAIKQMQDYTNGLDPSKLGGPTPGSQGSGPTP